MGSVIILSGKFVTTGLDGKLVVVGFKEESFEVIGEAGWRH